MDVSMRIFDSPKMALDVHYIQTNHHRAHHLCIWKDYLWIEKDYLRFEKTIYSLKKTIYDFEIISAE